MSGHALITILASADGLGSGNSSNLHIWPPANYVNPYERTWLPPIVITLWTISTVMLLLRIALRIRGLAGKVGIDDVMISLGWAACTTMNFCMLISQLKYHIGRHAWDIPLEYWTHITFYQYIAAPCFLFGTCFTKVSLLLFYRRLADGATTPRWKLALLLCIGLTLIWTFALVFGIVFRICDPINAYWLQFDLTWLPTHINTYHCIVTTAITPITASLTIFSDLYATILPCFLVCRLQIARRTKIALYTLFSLGLLATMFSIIRTVYAVKTNKEVDISWNMYYNMLFAQLESQLGIMCACLPSLRVFVKQHLPSISGSSLIRSARSKLERSGSSLPRSTDSHGLKSEDLAVTRVQVVDVEGGSSSHSSPLIEQEDKLYVYDVLPLEMHRPHTHERLPQVYMPSTGHSSKPYTML